MPTDEPPHDTGVTPHDDTPDSDVPLRGELVARPGGVASGASGAPDGGDRPERLPVRRGRPPAVRIRETEPGPSGAVVRRITRATPGPMGRVAMRRTFVNRMLIAQRALGDDHALSRLLRAISDLRDTNAVSAELADLLVTIRGLFDADGQRAIDALDLRAAVGDLDPARRRQVERVLLRLAEELEDRHGLRP